MIRTSSIPKERLNRKFTKLGNGRPYVRVPGQVFKFERKEEDYDEIDHSVFDREKIIKTLREIDDNIERIGSICANKKRRTNEENVKKFSLSKAMIDDELSKVRFKLSEAIKNSAKEDILKKLQHDFAAKRNQVSGTDKDVQTLNKILFGLQNQADRLKEENNFLMQEIRNSKDYQLYLENKKNELEESKRSQCTDKVPFNEIIKDKEINGSREEEGIEKEEEGEEETLEDQIDQIKAKQIEKLEKYFDKTEEMLRNKIQIEDKLLKEKYKKIKNLNNFKNNVQEIMRRKIKLYQINQVNEMTEKVSNKDIFFNQNDTKDITKSMLFKKNLTILKSKSEDNNKLNCKDKKEIMKMVLEDEEMKKIIFDYLFE